MVLAQPIIRFCYKRSKSLFNLLSSQPGKQARSRKKSFVEAIANCSDFVDICALYGYYAEEHIVQTGDGYLLGIHRLGWRKGEEGTRINSGPDSVAKKVCYLHHGLLMNSEVWVCLADKERCLPFVLVEQGYDVWLGNNRGNKYSKKSIHSSPASRKFWDFSMDEFAFHDIPNTIDYILGTTFQRSLSYIGFSQGTAQAFGALAVHPTLNDRVDVFIALAPAMSPAGLHNSFVDSLIKASPEVVFLAFGRRSILSSATMWQTILYPPIFVRFIDMSLSFLFNWSGKNISMQQKLAAYPHLYSYTSTKSIVHWFQIIRNKSFQMYDDDMQAPLSLGAKDRYYKVAKFPTRNIKTPVVLVYGGSDSLVDIKVMLKELPRHTVAKEVKHFEHLDFLWAQDVNVLVFPYVFQALESYAGRDHLDDRTLPYGLARNRGLAIEQGVPQSGDETSSPTVDDISDLESHTSVSGQSYSNSKKSLDRSSNYPRYLRKDWHHSPRSPSSPNSISIYLDSLETRTDAKAASLSQHPVEKRSSKRNDSISSGRSSDSLAKFGKEGIRVGTSRATVGKISDRNLHDEGH